MVKGTITDIVEAFQNRTSKAGKPYSASKVNVLLDSGEVVSNLLSFNEVAEGTSVDLEKGENGYWKIVGKKEAVANAQHDEIMKYLKDIRARLARLEGEDTTPAPKPAPAAPTQATGVDIARQTRDEYRAKQDTVINDIPEEIDLDSIPF